MCLYKVMAVEYIISYPIIDPVPMHATPGLLQGSHLRLRNRDYRLSGPPIRHSQHP